MMNFRRQLYNGKEQSDEWEVVIQKRDTSNGRFLLLLRIVEMNGETIEQEEGIFECV